LILDTNRIIGAFIELLMTDNTRMKEIQGELKRVSDTMGLHHDRYILYQNPFKLASSLGTYYSLK